MVSKNAHGDGAKLINIITICSNNFGNRLQNLALTKILRNMTNEPVVTLRIRDHKPFQSVVNKNWKALSITKSTLLGLFRKRNRTSIPFLTFTFTHIPTIQICPENMNDLEGLFVIGSDQCWNPGWGLGARIDGAQCAMGVSPKRKIAYAASMGIKLEDFPREWRERYASWLPEIESISMREEDGAHAVHEFVGRTVPVVLDPTMLLETVEWLAIERKPAGEKHLEGDYCLKYVLGSSTEADRIERIAAENGLSVFDINNTSKPIGPAEFLWLVHHAKIVCTDSFHGSVFSLLFHRPFVIFNRQDSYVDMSSRFETLENFSQVQAHRIDDDEFSWDAVWNMNWKRFETELATRRADSRAWLEAAIKKARTQNE